MGEFEGRHVVVTGGSGALGSAVVARLRKEGAVCSIPVLEERELARFALINDPGVRIVRSVDLTDESAVDAFYDQACAGRAGIWASVQIAGGFAMSPIVETTKADLLRQFETNAVSCFLCCRASAKRMSGGGRLVNVAARPALEPRSGAGMVAYTSAKAAVAAMTQAMGEELVGVGIMVNAVVPSVMDTPANRAAMPGADHSKWARLDQVAETVCFLASPRNGATRSGLVSVYGGA